MEQENRFEIDDLKKATWAMRKIAEAEKEKEKIQEVAEVERERIEEWEKKETKGYDDTIDYMQGLLFDYYKRERAENEKFKLSTPYGKVRSRKLQPDYNIEKDKAIEYLKNNGKEDMIKVEEKFNKTDFKKIVNVVEVDGELKAIDENGEVLDFVKVTPKGESYSISLDK